MQNWPIYGKEKNHLFSQQMAEKVVLHLPPQLRFLLSTAGPDTCLGTL